MYKSYTFSIAECLNVTFHCSPSDIPSKSPKILDVLPTFHVLFDVFQVGFGWYGAVYLQLILVYHDLQESFLVLLLFFDLALLYHCLSFASSLLMLL